MPTIEELLLDAGRLFGTVMDGMTEELQKTAHRAARNKNLPDEVREKYKDIEDQLRDL